MPRPWAHDITNLVTAKLPASERAKHHEGQGLFRVILDTDNGTVQRVVIVKSSGYSAIDQTIVGTLQQWRLRPHRWREFEVYVGLWLKRHGSNQAMQPVSSAYQLFDSKVCSNLRLNLSNSTGDNPWVVDIPKR
jgi:TonB family protein